MPPITICIPAYNEQGSIKNVLQDIANQNYTGQIITIVCDNNSTDNTSLICQQMGVNQVILEPRKGTRFAYNTAMSAATTKLILVTNADSRLPLNWVNSIVQAYNNPDVVAVGTDVSFYNAPAWVNKVLNLTKMLNPTPAMWGVSLSCTRQAFEQLGGFNHGTDLHEDAVFSLKLKKLGKVVILKDVVVLMDGRRFNNGTLSAIGEWLKGLGLNAISLQIKYFLGFNLKPVNSKFKDIRQE